MELTSQWFTELFFAIEAVDAVIYLLIIMAVLTLFVKCYRHLVVLQKRRRKVLKEEDFQAVSPSPARPSVFRSRRRALKAFDQRSNFFRKGLVICAITITVIIFSFPFLSELEATYLSFTLALFSMVLGYVAKPVIENFIAGLVISMGGRVKAGDTVTIDGHYGNIEAIYQTYATVKIWNWTKYIIPNSKLLQMTYLNHTHAEKFIWAHIVFTVDVDTDLDLVQRLACQAMASSEYVLSQFEPSHSWMPRHRVWRRPTRIRMQELT